MGSKFINWIWIAERLKIKPAKIYLFRMGLSNLTQTEIKAAIAIVEAEHKHNMTFLNNALKAAKSK